MSLTNRTLIREEISALFAGIAALERNLAYPPIALEGESPVLYLQAGGTEAVMLSLHANQLDHQFVATIAVNRERHGGAAAEGVLDVAYTSVLQAIRTTPTGTNYMSLVVDEQRSRPYFATVDGVAYRFEEIVITARSNITG
jgi:hypothetical protein